MKNKTIIKYIKEIYNGSNFSHLLLSEQCDMSENYILKLYKKSHS